ncbi:MAG: mechanosensitive ion channel domain-containing protein [Planctomycetota bacterium]|jgi:small-conductance mechanosensitive channel
MGIFDNLFSALSEALPLLVTVAATAMALWVAHWFLLRRRGLRTERRIVGQVTMLVLTGIGMILIVLALPVGDVSRGQLLALLGLALTAVITLSSTSFASNAMAGLMLRTIRSFRPGDFVRVGEEFGRVTERGLFHTEIQTEDRDLTTLPNLYLVTNPITVVRTSGTIVSARVSLGYDVPRSALTPLFQEAARQADLQDPFVQVTQLGDYSVTYRVAGFLPEVKHLLTARSTLRKKILDTLHEAGIEVASPTIMNQRPLPTGEAIVPARTGAPPPMAEARDELIFDKAEEAEEIEHLRAESERIAVEMKEIKKQIPGTEEPLRSHLEQELEKLRLRGETIAEALISPQKADD